MENKYGSGLKQIIELLKENGLNKPMQKWSSKCNVGNNNNNQNESSKKLDTIAAEHKRHALHLLNIISGNDLVEMIKSN